MKVKRTVAEEVVNTYRYDLSDLSQKQIEALRVSLSFFCETVEVGWVDSNLLKAAQGLRAQLWNRTVVNKRPS